MIAVYVDSNNLRALWILRIKFSQPYKLYLSMWEYEAATSEIKIAFTNDRVGFDYDIGDPERKTPPGQESEYPKEGHEDKINCLSRISQLVFVFDFELHCSVHFDIWDKCHHDNVYYVLAGDVHDHFVTPNVITWGSWFDQIASLYKSLPADYNYKSSKPKYFDALLGRPKPHRDFIYKAVIDNNLSDKITMTYIKDGSIKKFLSNEFILESECVPLSAPFTNWSDTCLYNGVKTALYRIIPSELFCNTAYSIVAETNFDNRLVFCTEKIAKPIIARRLFVVFSGYRFLEYLHKLGFKTFGHVIDESYDLIEDNDLRYAQAFEQVKRLCSMPQEEILSQITETVEHNYNLIMTNDWIAGPIEEIQNKINLISQNSDKTTI
jgi:hypothetical protein